MNVNEEFEKIKDKIRISTDWLRPHNQDARVLLWTFDLRDFLPNESIEKWARENFIGGNWSNSSYDDDEEDILQPPTWYWVEPTPAWQQAVTAVISGTEEFKYGKYSLELEELEQARIDQMKASVLIRLKECSEYVGKSEEELADIEAGLIRRKIEGPPRDVGFAFNEVEAE